MEHHLIKNKIHFTQAEGTSPIIESLTTILAVGTNQRCNNILEGSYKIPTHLPHLAKKYLINMKRDHNITQTKIQESH